MVIIIMMKKAIRQEAVKETFFGDGYTNYDAKGNKIGRSERNFFGDGFTNYDAKGKKIGKSEKNFFGDSYTNYDKNGKKIGKTHTSLWDSDDDEFEKEGCYIATAVYGSYDCPEVWILRRYRDNYLYKRTFGKIFIKIYYKVSPMLVKAFDQNKYFKKIFRKFLNNKIRKLKEIGYQDGDQIKDEDMQVYIESMDVLLNS